MRAIPLFVALASCTTPEPEPHVLPPAIHRLDAPPVALPRHEYTRLLATGAEPRFPVRYTLAAGTATAHVHTQMRSRVFAEHAWSDWVTVPSTAVDLAIAAAAIDDRGQLGPQSRGDDEAQRLLALVVQLPAEPIGVGATWRTVDVLRQRPAIVKQTATYTLLARTATTLHLGVELVRNGQPQTLDDGGTKAELESLHRTLTGTIDVDLARPFFTGTLELDGRMHLFLDTHERLFEDAGTIGVSS
jgi:hypothetical protein